MNFLEAVKAMKEGKKVKRTISCKTLFFHLAGGVIRYNDGNKDMVSLHTDDFEATDWEIVEDKKQTLSDKINSFEGTHVQFDYIYEKDVKKYINDFIRSLINNASVSISYGTALEIRKLAKEKFGEEIIR